MRPTAPIAAEMSPSRPPGTAAAIPARSAWVVPDGFDVKLASVMPVAFGTADDCLRGIREVADAGAELILFTALHDQLEHAEQIAAEIIPRLG